MVASSTRDSGGGRTQLATRLRNRLLVAPVPSLRGGLVMRHALLKTVFGVMGGALVVAAPTYAQKAEKFPTKPVRIVVGFSAGSATDITARMISPKLAELWGPPVVIENRSGAGSTLASTMVAQATPDGHTLMVVSTAFVITATLQKNLPYDARKDFRGVAQIGITTGGLMVAPSLGVRSVKELIALVKE